MIVRVILYVLVGLAAIGASAALIFGQPAVQTPRPCCPCPDCPDCPKCLPKEVIGQNNPEPQIDLMALPVDRRKANIASQGLGCCTFRSAEYAAHWQNVPALFGLPEWLKAKGIAGGGTPEKQARLVKQIASERGQPTPKFTQYEGNDPSIIELSLKTGRLPCVTWGGNHMLVCVHLDKERAAIVDNNAPEKVQWMSRQAFLSKWTAGGGGWVFVLLAPPPPPPPATRVMTDKVIDVPMYPDKAGTPKIRIVPPKISPEVPKIPSMPKVPERSVNGIDWVYGGVEKWTLNGDVVGRQEIEDALVDDSTKMHLTLIGTADERRSALSQLGNGISDRYHVQEYESDHWALAAGHLRTAKLYLQSNNGRVLLRCDTIEGLAGCLRRADPNYDPKKDPSGKPTLPGLPSLEGLSGYLPWAVGAAAVALLVIYGNNQAKPVAPPAPVAPVQSYQSLSPLDQAALDLGRRALAEAARKPQPT